ncbi:comF family protein [Peptostreptococcaceae bacterium pGA-8]|nr:comF family protein [Peptostreptococcaceae bacterium pGA-8]
MSDILEKVMELIFPSTLYCICCGNIIDESRPYSLCDHCMSRIKWRRNDPRLLKNTKAITCTEYGLYERRIIFRLKYNKKTFIARKIAEIMADRIRYQWGRKNSYQNDFDFDIIIPVPMYKKKERERGFNHAELIARYLGNLLNKKVIGRGLIRTRNTAPMRGLGPYERIVNIENAFKLNEKFKNEITGKKVLLLDDFNTTSSTLFACKKELDASGASEVLYISFAAKNI